MLIGVAMALAASGADEVAALVPGARVERAQERLAVATAGGDPASVRSATEELDRAEGGARAHAFADLTWVLLAGCALVVVVTTARLAGRARSGTRRWWPLAPALVVHLPTNWDMIAVALAGLGLLAWARSRPVAAGRAARPRDRDQALPGAVRRAAARALPAGGPAARGR